LQKQLFGRRSERIVGDADSQTLLLDFGEQISAPPQEVTEEIRYQRRKPVKNPGADTLCYPDNFPVKRVELDVAPHFDNYLNHPDARLDNNVAERAIRPLTIGRKNWLFVGSEDGGRASATLLSLVQTCRNLGINPQAYLEDVLRWIMGHPAQRIEELLPDQWLAAKQKDAAMQSPDQDGRS
jgi:hypothetical protein